MGERSDRLTGSNRRDSAGSPEWARSGNPTEIAGDIARTRSEMGETIEAIQDRLDPERLSQQAIGAASEVADQAVQAATEVTAQARDAAKEVVGYAIDEAKTAVRELTGQAKEVLRESTVGRVEQMAANTRGTAQHVQTDLLSTIKRNPVPAALAAAGIGWLWTHRHPAANDGDGDGDSVYVAWADVGADWDYASPQRRAAIFEAYGLADSEDASRLDRMGEQARQMGGQARQMAQHVAGQVQDRAGLVQEGAGQIPGKVHAAQHQAQGLWQMLEQNPIAVGAIGAVVGGIAGLLLPETEQEQQLMGETRDRVVGNVQGIVGETADKVQHVATEAAKTVADEAAAQGLTAAKGDGSARPAPTHA